jgi:hypothetical protein
LRTAGEWQKTTIRREEVLDQNAGIYFKAIDDGEQLSSRFSVDVDLDFVVAAYPYPPTPINVPETQQ